jgi:hypothetical protein
MLLHVGAGALSDVSVRVTNVVVVTLSVTGLASTVVVPKSLSVEVTVSVAVEVTSITLVVVEVSMSVLAVAVIVSVDATKVFAVEVCDSVIVRVVVLIGFDT